MVGGDEDGPAAFEGLAGNGDIAAERDEHSRAGVVGRRRGDAVGREGLRGCAQVELDTGRQAHGARVGVELDLGVTPGELARHLDQTPVAAAHMHERPVVAGQAQRSSDRRVDEAACLIGGRKRDLERVPEDRADLDRLPGRSVEEAQLGVLAKATARQVECTEPADELGASRGHRCRVRGQKHGRRTEGVQRGASRGGHEPPETTTGVAEDADTDGAADDEETEGEDDEDDEDDEDGDEELLESEAELEGVVAAGAGTDATAAVVTAAFGWETVPATAFFVPVRRGCEPRNRTCGRGRRQEGSGGDAAQMRDRRVTGGDRPTGWVRALHGRTPESQAEMRRQ